MFRPLWSSVGVVSLGLVMSAGIASAGDSGIKELDSRFLKAFNANDVEGIVACYADDAVLYPPDMFVAKGKDAIRKSYQEFLGQFKISAAKISDAGYLNMDDKGAAWGVVECTMTPVAGGEAIPMRARFTSASERRDGKWLYIVDHASMPMAPPPSHDHAH